MSEPCARVGPADFKRIIALITTLEVHDYTLLNTMTREEITSTLMASIAFHAIGLGKTDDERAVALRKWALHMADVLDE